MEFIDNDLYFYDVEHFFFIKTWTKVWSGVILNTLVAIKTSGIVSDTGKSQWIAVYNAHNLCVIT